MITPSAAEFVHNLAPVAGDVVYWKVDTFEMEEPSDAGPLYEST
ncbi:hypothetical protein [Gluconobacter wancherniae]|nr:hypothetical protein [Gluconobacter wancherniae]GBD55970.1 hypothetical protein NBRC103581_00543 [Gluconobacter wancherniae NBRC 103581]